MVIGRSEAISRGMKSYFTGIPCKNGHLCNRTIKGHRCIQCNRVFSAAGSLRLDTKNPMRRAEYFAKYRAKNSNKRNAYNKKYHAENKERRASSIKKWRAKNPAKMKSYYAIRRSRKNGDGQRYQAQDVTSLFTHQKGKCAYFLVCETFLGDDYHVDHVMPLALGGKNDAKNIQLTCPACNYSKNARHPAVFARSIGMLV